MSHHMSQRDFVRTHTHVTQVVRAVSRPLPLPTPNKRGETSHHVVTYVTRERDGSADGMMRLRQIEVAA